MRKRFALLLLNVVACGTAIASGHDESRFAYTRSPSSVRGTQSASATPTELRTLKSRLTRLQSTETERGLVVTLGDELFEVDRAAIKPDAMHALDQLARVLDDDKDARITIEGHIDSAGSRDQNTDLSTRRTDVVRAYLVIHGVDPARIGASGPGPEYSAASDRTESGHLQNRRVEVIIDSNAAR